MQTQIVEQSLRLFVDYRCPFCGAHWRALANEPVVDAPPSVRCEKCGKQAVMKRNRKAYFNREKNEV